jgi:hypothetical protein
MSARGDAMARRIKAFVENPITNLVKGSILLLIGLSETSHTLLDDITHRHLRIGHGLIIIGLFGILDAFPHFIEGLEASQRYQELRNEKARAESDADRP